MDETYLSRGDKPKNWLGIAFIALFVVAIGAGIYLFFKSREKIVSPVPLQPTFEVVFFTPTPVPASPTSTPSATPRAGRTPTVTPRPTGPTVTGKTSSPTPSVKASPSPTSKPSPSVTP